MRPPDMSFRGSQRPLRVAAAFLSATLLDVNLRSAYADTWTGTCVCNYDDPALSCHTSVFLTGTSVADLSQKCASATSNKGNLINLVKRTTPPSIVVNWCVAGPAPAGLPFEHATIGSKSDYWFCFDGAPGKHIIHGATSAINIRQVNIVERTEQRVVGHWPSLVLGLQVSRACMHA